MKLTRLIIILFISIYGIQQLEAQSINCNQFIQAKFRGDIFKYFENHLVYPPLAADNGIQGKLVLSFRINESGIIDSINVDTYPHISMAKDVEKILSSTKKKWIATVCDSAKISFNYKIIIDYIIETNGSSPVDLSYKYRNSAKHFVETKEYDKALYEINKAIIINKYASDFYEIRASIYKELKMADKYESDLNIVKELGKEIIFDNLVVVSVESH